MAAYHLPPGELASLYQDQNIPPPSHCFEFSRAQKSPAKKLPAIVSYLDLIPESINFPVNFVRPEQQTYRLGRGVHVEVDLHFASRLVDHLGGNSSSCIMTPFAVAIHLFAERLQYFIIGVLIANLLDN